MEYSETEKAFLHHLQTSLGPFEKFVAKMDIEENLPLVPDRRYIIENIADLLLNAKKCNNPNCWKSRIWKNSFMLATSEIFRDQINSSIFRNT